MKQFTKEQILKASKPKVMAVDMWECTIYLRKISAATALDFQGQDLYINGKLNLDLLASLVSKSVVDVNGDMVFTVEEAKDLDIESLTKLLQAIIEFNNLGEVNVEARKEEINNSPFDSSASS